MNQERYLRHAMLPGWNAEIQKRFRQACVMVVGAGGLGCPALQYLVAAGVGTIFLFDDDIVSESNLARQILYSHQDIGAPKALCAASYLQRLNPEVLIVPYIERVTPKILAEFLPKVSVVVDGCDNFSTRYWVNDACVALKKPLVYGAVYQYEGQLAVFNVTTETGEVSGNLRDIFPEIPAGKVATCAEAGVLNALTGVIGSMMAAETIKLITQIGRLNLNKLTIIDLASGTFKEIRFEPSNQSVALSTREPNLNSAIFCQRKNEKTSSVLNILPNELVALKEQNADYQLVDVRSVSERLQFSLGGTHCPLEEINALVAQLNPKLPVILYCHSGQRSRYAAEIIAENTSFRVYNLTGGIARFKNEYPKYVIS